MLRKHTDEHAKADTENCGCMNSFAEQFKEGST